MHEHTLLVGFHENDFRILLQGCVAAAVGAEALVEAGVVGADRVASGDGLTGGDGFAVVLLGTRGVVEVVLGIGTFVDADFHNHGVRQVGTEFVGVLLVGDVACGVFEVFEDEVHHLCAGSARAEESRFFSRVESLFHQGHIAIAAHEVEIAFGTVETGLPHIVVAF